MNIISNPEHSLSLETSKNTDKIIRGLGKALLEIQKKHFPDIRPPIIAGGSVRDAVVGVRPKDYDIFFDISSFEESGDDAVLLMTSHLVDALKTSEFLDFDPIPNIMAVGNNPPYDGVWPPKSFYGYEIWFDGEGEDHWRAVDNFLRPSIQIIGHVNKKLTDYPLEFVNEFDYSLVKAFYDPLTEEYIFHPEFIKSLKTKIIETKEDKTRNRALGWAYRAEMQEHLAGIKFPYTVEHFKPTGLSIIFKAKTNSVPLSARQILLNEMIVEGDPVPFHRLDDIEAL